LGLFTAYSIYRHLDQRGSPKVGLAGRSDRTVLTPPIQGISHLLGNWGRIQERDCSKRGM